MNRDEATAGLPTVGIILLTMNQREITLRCLESLAQVARPPEQRIVLWDNGSTDGTAAAVAEQFPDVLYRHHPENAGVASGRNQAVDWLLSQWQPDLLFFMDNDMMVEPDFLAHLVQPFLESAQIGQATSKIRDLNDHRRLYGAGGCHLQFWLGNTSHIGYGELDQGQYDHLRDCIPSGGSLCVRTAIFQELGGFTTEFDPYGPEDLDFGLRVRRAGYEARFVPEAIIYHETRPGRTFEGGTYSETFARNRARHWFAFMHRHASTPQIIGFYLVGLPYRLLLLLLREARRGNVGPALRGLWRGLRQFLVTGDGGRKG